MVVLDSRSDIPTLIQHLRRACQEPLYVNIEANRLKWRNHGQDPYDKRSRSCDDNGTRSTIGRFSTNDDSAAAGIESSKDKTFTWEDLVFWASDIAPFLTIDEHQQVLHLVGILFLGYLLPHSTSCGSWSFPVKFSDEKFQKDPFFSLSLAERLTQATQSQQGTSSSIITPTTERPPLLNSIVDPYREVSFDSFLTALERLVSVRSVVSADLVHLLAFAIRGGSNSVVAESAVKPILPMTRLSRLHTKVTCTCPHWTQTQEWINDSSIDYHFQLHYGHILRLVRLVVDHLNLSSAPTSFALLHGAIPHLQMALRAFDIGVAQSLQDSSLAQRALISATVLEVSAAYSPNFGRKDDPNKSTDDTNKMLKDYTAWWDILLPTMVEDRNCYSTMSDNMSFSPHSARSALLEHYLIQTCHSKAAVDPAYLHKIVSTISDAVEWQVDCWTKKDDDDNDGPQEDPKLLASLLSVTKLVFLLEPSRLKDDDDDEDDLCHGLVETCVGLLSHSAEELVEAATHVLRYVLLYDVNVPVNLDNMTAAVISCFERQQQKGKGLCQLIGAICDRSPSHALAILQKVQPMPTTVSKENVLLSVALNCPAAAASVLEDNADSIVPFLAAQQADFFPNDDKEKKSIYALQIASKESKLSLWERYRLARHSIVVGCHSVAVEALKPVHLTLLNNHNHFLWICAVQNVAIGENLLRKEAALGMPGASTALNSALHRLQDLVAFQEDGICDCSELFDYNFSIRFLTHRLDLLDLMIFMRQAVREVRLTGQFPEIGTRPFAYIQKTVSSFNILAKRYQELYRQYGLRFRHRQSRVALRLCHGLSLFLATACRAFFPSANVSKDGSVLPSFSKTTCRNLRHPLARLLHALYDKAVKPLQNETASEATLDICSTVLLEVIDGILLAPFSWPRDFFLPKKLCSPGLRLLSTPGSDSGETLESVTVWPMVGFSVELSGFLPQRVLEDSLDPITAILVSFRARLLDNTDEDDENVSGMDTTEDPRVPDYSSISPFAMQITPNGRFESTVECVPFVDEGVFSLEAVLGCRDLTGRVWEFPSVHKEMEIVVQRVR